jgi:hypothetical protein
MDCIPAGTHLQQSRKASYPAIQAVSSLIGSTTLSSTMLDHPSLDGVLGKRVEGRSSPEVNMWHINDTTPQDEDLAMHTSPLVCDQHYHV